MIKISKHFSPSKIVATKEFEMSEIMITCGGGMGGAQWCVYTKDEFDLNNNFISIDTNKDKNTIINTKYIVQVRPVKIVKVTLENLGHSCYGGKGALTDWYYLVRANDDVVVIDNVDHDNKLIEFNNKII